MCRWGISRLPEVSSRNTWFGAIESSEHYQKLFRGALRGVPPAVTPKEGEILITRHCVSAFAGTDLRMTLRANNVDTLVCSASLPAASCSQRCSRRRMTIFAWL